MDIVRGNQTEVQVACDFYQIRIDPTLRIEAEIVKFDKVIFRSENLSIRGSGCLGLVKASGLQKRGDFSFQASAQGDDAFRMGGQALPVHAGLVVKALQISSRGELHEIPVALVVCRQKREMKCGILRG